MRIERLHELRLTDLLPYLNREGTIQISWGKEWSMGIETGKDEIVLKYMCGDERVRQVIKLDAVPSNLGMGNVLYFVCPTTGRRCRKLYRATCYFHSRRAYRKPYYNIQFTSGLDRLDARYWKLEKAISKLTGKGYTPTYKGKPTSTARRVQALQVKLQEVEHYRMCLFIEKLDALSMKAGYS